MVRTVKLFTVDWEDLPGITNSSSVQYLEVR